VEACRQIGVGRKTGYRWWAELGGIRPLTRLITVRPRRALSVPGPSSSASDLSLRTKAELLAVHTRLNTPPSEDLS
jgi:hypothetical protein